DARAHALDRDRVTRSRINVLFRHTSELVHRLRQLLGQRSVFSQPTFTVANEGYFPKPRVRNRIVAVDEATELIDLFEHKVSQPSIEVTGARFELRYSVANLEGKNGNSARPLHRRCLRKRVNCRGNLALHQLRQGLASKQRRKPRGGIREAVRRD